MVKKSLSVPLSEVSDLFIDNLRGDGRDGDKIVGGVFCRNLGRRAKECGKSITPREPFGPIDRKWLIDTLSGHLKELQV